MWIITTAILAIATTSPAATGGDGAERPQAGAARSSFWWGDWDDDHLPDAFVVRPDGSGLLIRNAGDGTFDDVTARSGLASVRGVLAALWRDFDGDGRTDLYLVAPADESLLLRNTPAGLFEEVTVRAGLERSGVLAAAWLDFDRDDRPDLSLTTSAGEALYRNVGGGAFEAVMLHGPLAGPLVARSTDGVLARGTTWTVPSGGSRERASPGTSGRPDAASSSTSGATVGGTSALPNQQNAGPEALICAGSLEDFVNPGTCMGASSVPALGMLYPVSAELYVDAASGRVGIGTLTPAARLDVAGDLQVSERILSSLPTGTAPFAVASTTHVPNLNVDRLDGLDSTDLRLAADLIESGDLAADAVTSAAIQDGAVTSDDVADGTLTAADLAPGVIGSGALAADSVTTSHVLDGTLQGVDIAPASIGALHLRSNAVGSAQVIDASLTGDDLATGAVTTVHLATGAVYSVDIQDGQIRAEDIGTGQVGSSEIASGAVGSAEIATGGVRSTEILDGAILDVDVATNAAIAGTKIAADFGSQFVTTNNRVGVGTTAPLTAFHSALGNLGVTSTHMSSDDLLIESTDAALGLYSSEDGNAGSSLSLKEMNAGALVDTWGIARETTGGGARLRITHGTNVNPFSNATMMSFEPNGSVGVGTSDPGDETKLDLTTDKRIGLFSFTNDTDYTYAYGVVGHSNATTASRGIGVEGSSEGQFGTGVSGRSYGSGSFGVGVHGYDDEDGIGVLGQTESNSGVSYGVRGEVDSPTAFAIYGSGQFGGTGTKYFIQPHPTDPSKEIRFVCLEGNEAGTYFRGTSRLAGGSAVIEVPEEFRLVSETDALTVQVTALGGPALLWVDSKDLERIVVRGSADVEFDYMVNGIRRGYRELELVHENRAYRPKERGVPYGSQYPEAHRRILVENGTLNPDYTPNEATAAALGWTLIDAVERRHAEPAPQGE